MITKDFFEKQIKKHGKATVYSQDSIPLNITKVPCIRCDTVNMVDFDMDCLDLFGYCQLAGLTLKPANKN